MPNWIQNYVSIRGTTKERFNELIKKHFKKGTLDFNTIIPQPRLKRECPIQYICDPKTEHIEADKKRHWFNWYAWNYDNWGVKWNACEGYIDNDYNGFYFETPWSCPMPVLLRLSQLYPELEFFVDVDGEIDEPYGFRLKGGEEI